MLKPVLSKASSRSNHQQIMFTVEQPERKIRHIRRIFSSLKSQISTSKLPASENFIGKNIMYGKYGRYVPVPPSGLELL
jgi:hypothetical protein